jgi:hypothetical protein
VSDLSIKRFLFIASVLVSAHTLPAQESATSGNIRFNKDIRPLLSEYCFACHGPDSGSREGDLRLDLRDFAVESGAIVPGKAAESELVTRINSDDPEAVMPPPAFRKRPTTEEKKLLTDWIAAGAEWEAHWAFVKPVRPKLPRPAGVEDWAVNPIDHFVLDEIRKLELNPGAPADRYALGRRAALDITGLPPLPNMLDTFVADSADNAFENYVDRLLASNHAGENRARYWLDAARYGDTHGMHVDNYREIWPYRDWVVNAFNANMPFDRFVVEQIAGDLLPNTTRNQRIATGFNRCNITTSEGGAIPAELDVRYMVDRVETTSTVFLGLTAGCAVCHDHKFDPISQREFYQLGAFFNNTTTPAMDGNQKDTPPVVTLPAAEHKNEWNLLQTRRRELTELIGRRFGAGVDGAVIAKSRTWWENGSRDIHHPVAQAELMLSLPLTEGEDDSVGLPKGATWAGNHPAGKRGMRFGDNASEISVELPAIRTDQPLTVSFWFRTPDQLVSTVLFEHMTKVADKKTAGWKISSSTQGAVTFELTDPDGKKIRGLLPGEEAVKPHSWQHVCVRYSGGQSNSSISILVDGQARVLRNSTEDYIAAAELPSGLLKIAGKLPTAGLSDVRIFRRWLTGDEVQLLAREFEIKRLLQTDDTWTALKPDERLLLTRYHGAVFDEESRPLLLEFSRLQQRRDYIYSRSTTTLVMQERPSPPKAWVLERGEYDQKREEVTPGVPGVLPPLPQGVPVNRLALARWLVHPDHPLTARVMVNRLWQSIFGTGLVRTSEDFGVMGDRPSHPELLDWLAVEFVESGWDVNHILKLILTSATYRQTSAVTAEKLAKDKDNRFLSRGPRVRLDAEVLRDQALAVSGLLRRDMGGPSVKPYQPAGLWNVVAITGSNTRVYKKDSGDALYRRSLYTFWKRTSPPPTMAAFNAPTREQCTVRRERTNTPIQALVLMNDPQFVESARHLAEHAIRQQPENRARAAWMLMKVLSRPGDDADVADILASVSELEPIFAKDAESAKKLIATGDSTPDESLDAIELAVWTIVANTLMNRDDVINK